MCSSPEWVCVGGVPGNRLRYAVKGKPWEDATGDHRFVLGGAVLDVAAGCLRPERRLRDRIRLVESESERMLLMSMLLVLFMRPGRMSARWSQPKAV